MQPVVLLVALAVMGVGFGVIEWRWPSIRGQRRLRAGVLTDLAYYAITPTVGKLFTGVVVFITVIVIARILGADLTSAQLRGLAERDTTIGRQPIGLQLIEFILLADLLSYWQHRAFHSFSRLWRIHAVHHSSTELDWLSAVRVHPLNDTISTAVIATPLLLLGFAPGTLAAYLPFLTLYAILLHANVSWSFGPLRHVIATPVFHRWHHSNEDGAIDKNFGGLFLFWDRLFGTLYLPAGLQATRFGVRGGDVPAGFLGQLAYPFRHQDRQRILSG